jgi:hypothetical protein
MIVGKEKNGRFNNLAKGAASLAALFCKASTQPQHNIYVHTMPGVIKRILPAPLHPAFAIN